MSAAPRLKRRPKRRLSDLAYSRIRGDIIRCLLGPGVEVTEAQLASRYRLGKSPVRSALARLCQEGLLQPLPRRGYLVAPVTLQDVHDIFQLRLVLEPAVARLAVGRTDNERLRELDAICKAGYVPGDKESEAAFLKANKEFHVTIARASGNRRLCKTISDLLDEMERLLHLGLSLRNRTDEMQHEHRALLEALSQGDEEAAERVTQEQIETARKMVIDALLSSPAIMEVTIKAPAPTARSEARGGMSTEPSGAGHREKRV